MCTAFGGGRLTVDEGVLVLAEIEHRLRIAERLARRPEDPRMPERMRHTVAEMIRFRMLLIAAGYLDTNDCDALGVALKLATCLASSIAANANARNCPLPYDGPGGA